MSEGTDSVTAQIKQLMQEEEQLQEHLDSYDMDLQHVASTSEDQDSAIRELSTRISQKSADAAELERRVGELSDTAAEIREQPQMGQVGLEADNHELELVSSLAQANTEIRQKVEAQRGEIRDAESRLGNESSEAVSEAVLGKLNDFYFVKDQTINEVKEFQDMEADITASLARRLREVAEMPARQPEMRAKNVGHQLSKAQFLRFYKMAATVPVLARRLRERQFGVFTNLQELQDKLNQILDSMAQ